MTQKYQVKVSMKQAAIVETGIVLKQGDFGMQIEIEVLDFDVTGTTPQIVFRKAMGAVESTTITVSGNKYTYTFKGTELDTPGKCFCDLKLKNSTTQRISTASFMFKVVADTLDGLAEEASSYSDTIEQLMADVVHLSETPGLVRNDGSIDATIEGEVTAQGAKIDDLKSSINDDRTRNLLSKIMLNQGAIEGYHGQIVPTNQNRVYTSPMVYGESIEVNSGYLIAYVFEYDENGFITFTTKDVDKWEANEDLGRYYRLVIRKTNSSESISPSENIIKSVSLIQTYDKVFEKINEKADITSTNLEFMKVQNAAKDSPIRIVGDELNLYSGALNGTTGEYVANTKRVYSMPIFFGDIVEVNSGYTIRYIYRYTDDGLQQISELINTKWSPASDLEGTYYRITISKTDADADISPTENIVKNFTSGYSYSKAKTLRQLENEISSVKGDIFGRTVEVKNFRIVGTSYTHDGSSSFLIGVKAGETVTFKPGQNTSYFLMVNSYTDAQLTPDYATGYSSYGEQVTDSVKATVPTGAKYLIVLKNVSGTSDRTPEAIIINGYDLFKSVVENVVEIISEEGYSNLSKPIDLLANNSGYSDGELKWLSIGDSYTEINDTENPTIRRFIEKGYQDRVCEKLPIIECTNIGHSGWTFINWESSLSQITAGYDLYTIMLGTNDWSLSANWGTITDFTNRTSNTSLGAFGKIIDKIKSVAPDSKIIVMTQFHRTVAIVPGGTVIEARNHDTYLPNSLGLYFADMEQDIIDCCESENIEYLDVFKLSNVTPFNAMKYAKVNVDGIWEYLRYPEYLDYIVFGEATTNPYDSTTYWAEYDGCHPSKVGMEIISNLLIEKIKEVMFK